MSFEFKTCSINGIAINLLYEIQPKTFNDARGYFFENYNKRDFEAVGIAANFVQDNESQSVSGVLRGFHFQTKHPQAKLVRAVIGQVFDIAVDLRNDSPTFGKCHCVILDGEKKNQLYIPRGFAHGFYVLSKTAIIAYKCDNFYDVSGEGGIHFASVDAFASAEAFANAEVSASGNRSAMSEAFASKASVSGSHSVIGEAFSGAADLASAGYSAIADFSAVAPILSEKDKQLPPFDKNKKYFSLDGVWIGD